MNFHAKCQSVYTKQVTLVMSSKEETSSLIEKNLSVTNTIPRSAEIKALSRERETCDN